MQHDKILKSVPEMTIIDKEASRVAQQAIQALKESRKLVQKSSGLGLPTWTGKSGSAGAFEAAPSSASILSNLRMLSS